MEITVAVSVSALLVVCAIGFIYRRLHQRESRMAASSEVAWTGPVLPDNTQAVTSRYEPLVRHPSESTFSPPAVLSHRHAASGAVESSDIRLLLSDDTEILESLPNSLENSAIPQSLQIPSRQIQIEADGPNAVGSFKTAWAAWWGGRRVALLDNFSGPRAANREAIVLQRIGPHPNVVEFLGFCQMEQNGNDEDKPAGLILVMDWASAGRLDKVTMLRPRCGSLH